MKKKSRVYYFGGKRKVRKDAGFKDIAEIQLEEGAIQKINYKTGIFKDGVPMPFKERKELHQGKRRFLVNVARLIKIAQLERKVREEPLSDKEKLQLIKLDREFDVMSVVLTLEREEAGRIERGIQKGVYEPSPSPYVIGKEGKIQLGGKSEGKEAQLKATLIKHKKAIAWSEEEYKTALAKERGKRTAQVFAGRKKRGVKEARGRKKGTVFDAKLKRYVTAKERAENG